MCGERVHSLHALGILHQLQGEYGPARERYEQSLAMRAALPPGENRPLPGRSAQLRRT